MKRILVTGASGFVGSRLIENLKRDSNNVVVALRRDVDNSQEVLEDYSVRGDLEDYDLVRRMVSDYEIESVYHMASNSIVRICAEDPRSAYSTNVMGTVNLLEAIRQGAPNIKSVVISTSDKAFGHAPVPYDEESPLKPKYTYEATKACQDIVGQNYFHNYRVPVKIARLSNIYGPGDPNCSRVIPNTIRRLLEGQGAMLYTDVADHVREFIYIDDAIEAYKTLDKHGTPGEPYCVGGGSVLKAKDLVKLISDLIGSEMPVEFVERSSVFKEIQEQYMDSSKIMALGWKPKMSLEEGIKKTIKYYKKVFNHE